MSEKIFKDEQTVDGFQNFVARVGLNNDNTISNGFYALNLVTRNRLQLESAYRGSWVVGQVIDAVADDMTRSGIDINTNEGEEDIKDLKSEIAKKQIWSSINSLIKWGRLYGGAIAIFQIEGQDLRSPLNLDTITQNQFKGLVIYDRWQLNPVIHELIESGPDMGLPKYYQIVDSDVNLGAKKTQQEIMTGMQVVHYSRIIRVQGIKLPYYQAITENLWGESVLERLWDRLISFDTATMSCANLIERANNRTIGIDKLREIIAAGGKAQQGLERMFEMMRTFQTNEGLTLLDKEDTFTSTSYSFAGLSDVMLNFGQQLSGSSGIPLVRLFGQSPAGLNSTGDSDIRMYYDMINSQQEAQLRTGLDKLIRIMWRSTFGKPEPKDLEFKFTPLWQMSAQDQANIAKTNTETIVGAREAGLISDKTAMQELRNISANTGLFSNISDEDIDTASEVEEPPMPEMEPNNEGSIEPVKNFDGFFKRLFKAGKNGKQI